MEGIIFDVDGTLVDNMMIHHRAWQRQLKVLGLDYSLERVKAEIHGVNIEILKRLFGDKYSAEELKQIAWEKEATYRSIYATEIAPLPGLMDFLSTAKNANIPMAVATAGPPENCAFVLDSLGIREYFGHVVHAAMVTKGKPDPEAFQQAADGINVPLEHCLVFEDSVTGAKAAANGNCASIIITTTHQPDEFAAFDNILEFREDYREISCLNYFK